MCLQELFDNSLSFVIYCMYVLYVCIYCMFIIYCMYVLCNNYSTIVYRAFLYLSWPHFSSLDMTLTIGVVGVILEPPYLKTFQYIHKYV
jgi:hypothetical protein